MARRTRSRRSRCRTTEPSGASRRSDQMTTSSSTYVVTGRLAKSGGPCMESDDSMEALMTDRKKICSGAPISPRTLAPMLWVSAGVKDANDGDDVIQLDEQDQIRESRD